MIVGYIHPMQSRHRKYMPSIFINHLLTEEVTLANSQQPYPRTAARALRKNIVTSDIQLYTDLVIRNSIERESFYKRRSVTNFFYK